MAATRIALLQMMAKSASLVSTVGRTATTTTTNSRFPHATRHTFVTITQTSAAAETTTDATTSTLMMHNESTPTSSTNTMTTDGIIVTDACFDRVRSLIEKRNNDDDTNDTPKKDLYYYLRVYVDAGGCSGFQYKFELTADSEEPIDETQDVVYTSNNNNNDVRVVVDTSSLELLRGSTIDFVQEMIKSSFAVVENPQSESACGCGSSFAVKNFTANPALD